MPVSHKHKVIFVHVPKCAGTSIEYLLDINDIRDFFTMGRLEERRQIIPIDKFTTEEYEICLNKNMQHYTYRELSKILSPYIMSSHKIISVVRNPYTRLVSEFYFLNSLPKYAKNKITFEDLVTQKLQLDRVARNKEFDGHLETQTSFLINDSGNFNSIDKIYKFENLKECLNDISTLTGNTSYPHLRASKTIKPYEEHYTPELREIVYNFYKEDFINFEYIS